MLRHFSKLSFIFSPFLIGQTIQINEIVSSNQNTFYDEDGDTPDWIELYNTSANSVSLYNWGLSDDVNNLFKWGFPIISIGPEQYLLVMASDKDRTDIIAQWETIINWGDQGRYFIGDQPPPTNWNQLGFSPMGWDIGPSGFGYGDNDDNTVITPATSIYIRKSFYISDSEHVKKIALHIDLSLIHI